MYFKRYQAVVKKNLIKIIFLPKLQKINFFVLKSIFQNKIIIRQQDAKLEKVL
jgi:hypothetical protein